jgi:hypothetical protein
VVERFPVVGRLEVEAAPKGGSHAKGLLVAIITAVVLMLAFLLFR